MRSLNVAIRQILDLYICQRPVQYFDGTPSLSLTTESTFNFKIRRFADLLMDCYRINN